MWDSQPNAAMKLLLHHLRSCRSLTLLIFHLESRIDGGLTLHRYTASHLPAETQKPGSLVLGAPAFQSQNRKKCRNSNGAGCKAPTIAMTPSGSGTPLSSTAPICTTLHSRKRKPLSRCKACFSAVERCSSARRARPCSGSSGKERSVSFPGPLLAATTTTTTTTTTTMLLHSAECCEVPYVLNLPFAFRPRTLATSALPH